MWNHRTCLQTSDGEIILIPNGRGKVVPAENDRSPVVDAFGKFLQFGKLASAREGERRRHDADNFVGLTVKQDLASEYIATAGQPLLPELIADDEESVVTGLVLAI